MHLSTNEMTDYEWPGTVFQLSRVTQTESEYHSKTAIIDSNNGSPLQQHLDWWFTTFNFSKKRYICSDAVRTGNAEVTASTSNEALSYKNLGALSNRSPRPKYNRACRINVQHAVIKSESGAWHDCRNHKNVHCIQSACHHIFNYQICCAGQTTCSSHDQ